MPSTSLLYYTGKEVRWREYRAGKEERRCSSEWKDSSESNIVRLSTKQENKEIEECHRRIKACACVWLSFHDLTSEHLCAPTGLFCSLCWACFHTMWPHGSSLGGWLHLFVYTGMDRGVDWLRSWYSGLDQREAAGFFLGQPSLRIWGQGLFLLHGEPR